MSIVTPLLLAPTAMPSSAASWPLHRFSVADYERFVAVGAFNEDDPVELLEGWVVEKMPKNPLHDGMIDLIQSVLMRVLPDGWYVRVQNSLVTSDSVPEPDLAVVRGSGRDYLRRHPQADDTILVIEVADSSVGRDREKKRIYARAGVPAYWIVNLDVGCVEAFTNPDPSQGEYQSTCQLRRDGTATFVVPSIGLITVPATELIPPSDLA